MSWSIGPSGALRVYSAVPRMRWLRSLLSESVISEPGEGTHINVSVPIGGDS